MLHKDCHTCTALLKGWNELLKTKGFKDIEDTDSPLELLKSWSGDVPIETEVDGELVNILDFELTQDPEDDVKSSFPPALFDQEAEFMFGENYKDACRKVASSGILNSRQVSSIWERYLEGETRRAAGKRLGVSRDAIQRVVRQLRERAKLMGNEEEIVVPPTKIVLRKYMPQVDEPFLYASWRNSLWYDHHVDGRENADKFFRLATKTIRKILASGGTEVLVAVEEGSPLFILGYSVKQEGKLTWVYVKADYRMQGLGTLLSKNSLGYGTAVTRIGKAILKAKGLLK